MTLFADPREQICSGVLMFSLDLSQALIQTRRWPRSRAGPSRLTGQAAQNKITDIADTLPAAAPHAASFITTFLLYETL